MKIKPMISMTLLSVLVSLVVGCETSNQNYTNSGRVVDVTKTSSSTTVNRGNVGVTAAPSVNTNTTLSETVLESDIPAASTVVTPPKVETSVSDSSGLLIGGVPDEPMPPVSAPSTQAATNSSSAQSSTSSGNWLLVDSDAAQKDVNNTAQTQQVLSGGAINSPDRYTVVRGDTLYSIAFRYGLDYHALATNNKIAPPYNLAVGQVLILNLKAQEAPSYIVQKGDTLYSIARKNNQSVSFLAGVNNLEPPYNLKLGQKILLSRADSASSTADAEKKASQSVPVAGQQSQIATNTTTTTTTTSGGKTTVTTNKTTTTTTTAQSQKVPANAQTPIINSKTRKVAGVTWSWPTTGKVIEQFSTAEQGNKGIDIAGNRGQAILSAADGQVVYSGNALRGFGNLIIINHNNEYLSAYAHNDVMLVKEGQKVKRGQHIARMGSTDAASTRLHFEIRYRGQSVNPVSYLPK